MDDSESGLVPKRSEADRSNTFHRLPHTIEDICTQQSMSSHANNLFFSPIRHVLPQIPTRGSNPRMAVSKTHREMFSSSLGSKQDTSMSMMRQLDLPGGEREGVGNSDESQDQLPLDGVQDFIPSWKETEREAPSEEDSEQKQEISKTEQDVASSYQQEKNEAPADPCITSSGFQSSPPTSIVDSFLVSPHQVEHHQLSNFLSIGKDADACANRTTPEFFPRAPGMGMGPRIDRNSQLSSLSTFNNPQASWQAFDYRKGFDSQGSEVAALEHVIEKVDNPLSMLMHQQPMSSSSSSRNYEDSQNPIKLKIRRGIGSLEHQQQQQQIQQGSHPMQQAHPSSHMTHGRMMPTNHQMSMDFQLQQQQQKQQHLHQQHPYLYESATYARNQGGKEYYAGNGSDGSNSSSSAVKSIPSVLFPPDYQDSSVRHLNPYAAPVAFPQGQLQQSHLYHPPPQQQQSQLGNQQYAHYHMTPPASSTPSHRPPTPLSSAMMVLHGAAPSPPIFNYQPQQSVPSPSAPAVRPKTGRAKTNAELKKQLMEKRAGQHIRASGDGSSQASSPAPSQVEVSSPKSISSSTSGSSPNHGNLLEASGNSNGLDGQMLVQDKSARLQHHQGTYAEMSEAEMQKLQLSWQLGDLVWARVAGHPWWPAMVTADPINGQFFKLAPRGQKNQYHMQFFGEEMERGWVIESSAIPFEGKEAFGEFCQRKLQENKKDRKLYKIPSSHKKAWEASVRSAEKALVLTRQERFAQMSVILLPVYSTKRSGRKSADKDGKKRKSRSDRSSSSDKLAKKSKKNYDVNKNISTIEGGLMPGDAVVSERDSGGREYHHPQHQLAEASHIVLPKNVSNQYQAQFTVFCRKKRDTIAQENATWSPAEVDAHLWQLWSRLDDETRSRFIPMGSDFTYLSQMMQSVSGGSSGTTVVDVAPTPLKLPVIIKPNGMIEETPKSKNMNSKSSKPEEGKGRKKGLISKSQEKHDSNQGKILGDGKREETGESGTIIDEVCFVCEKPDLNVVQCRGPCRGLFHRHCIGLPPANQKQTSSQALEAATSNAPASEILPSDSVPPEVRETTVRKVEISSDVGKDETEDEEIMCPQCKSKTHKCSECGELLKLTEATTVLCSVTDCGRFYHRACVDVKFFKTPDRLICPLHSCLTCRVRNKVKDSELTLADEEDLDFYECIKCPAAFHIPGVCLAAGAKYLAGPFVICSRHFSPVPKTHPLHARFGATWCFSCEKTGGHMLNCESCPAAYHPSCLKISSHQSVLENWQCPDCIAGIHPLYGDVVWVKFGSYRWWPAQVYWPYEVPQNIVELPHDTGEFPVCFFGSRDYLWLNRRRVFPFRIGDKCCKEALRKSGGKVFDKAIREAISTYELLRTDPTSSASATSSLFGLTTKKPHRSNAHKNDGGVLDDAKDPDKVRGRKRKSKTTEKEKQFFKPVRSTRNQQDANDQAAENKKEKDDDGDDAKCDKVENVCRGNDLAVASGNSDKVALVSPPTHILSPQVEKDMSELRAKLKQKRQQTDFFSKKSSFSSLSRSSKKTTTKSHKDDSGFSSTPSSVVLTLINRPLLQGTSLPGVHDLFCSWCGREGESSEESDFDGDNVDACVSKLDEVRKDIKMITESYSDKKIGDAIKLCVDVTKDRAAKDEEEMKNEAAYQCDQLCISPKNQVHQVLVSSRDVCDEETLKVNVPDEKLSKAEVNHDREVSTDVKLDDDSVEIDAKSDTAISSVCSNENGDKDPSQHAENLASVSNCDVGDSNNNRLKDEPLKSTKDVQDGDDDGVEKDNKIDGRLSIDAENSKIDETCVGGNANEVVEAASEECTASSSALKNVTSASKPMKVTTSENRGMEMKNRGRLIYCDKVKCSKVYHYKCLRITKLPHGHWLCPLHQCTICGRASTHQCSKCPNAFCLEHFPHCLSYTDDGSSICTGHPEAPPVSEELVNAILDEMAVMKEAEAGHGSTSNSHRKSSKNRGEEGEDAADVATCLKIKKRKRSTSSSQASSMSMERKKTSSKKNRNRKKVTETKDVSFEKRILPSRVQSRRFLDSNVDSDDNEDGVNDLSLVSEKKKKGRHLRQDLPPAVVASICDSKDEGKLKKKIECKNEGEARKSIDEKFPKKHYHSRDILDIKTLQTKIKLKKPQELLEISSKESKKVDSSKRSVGGSDVKSKEKKTEKSERKHEEKRSKSTADLVVEDRFVISKKKKKKLSEKDVPGSGDEHKSKNKSNHSKKKETSNNDHHHNLDEPLPLLTTSSSLSSPDRIFPTPSLPSSLPPSQILPPSQSTSATTATAKKPPMLPPPSSPDDSPMFDNSDDEFPGLVIDVPM